MKWSIIKSKMFSQCPRKWYYFDIVASSRARDPLRREAYLLKQLQSLHAWRGSLVDSVVEKFIVPRMRSNNFPSEDEVIAFSMSLMDKQLEFGKARKYRYHNVTKSKAGNIYCALYDLEYDRGLDEDALREVKEDVVVALRNLVRSDFLKQIMKSSSFFAAQRSFILEFENTTISCTPDLIAFFPDMSPLITDWKVHSFANTDSWLQLGVYTFALSRVKPHRDFPKGTMSQLKDPTTFRLIEYQLLKNQQRVYSVSPEDIANIEDYIFKSCVQMNRLLNGKKHNELDINQFQTARSPEICERCQFKRLCWRRLRVKQGLLEEWV